MGVQICQSRVVKVEPTANSQQKHSEPSPQLKTQPERATDPSTAFQPGDVIDGHYEVLAAIAAGGCGFVYKVNDVLMQKVFALKILNKDVVSEKSMLRLRKEAQAAAKLDHPNLVRSIYFGLIDDAQPYLVMDFADGPTLSEYLKQHGAIPWTEALRIFIPVCNAVAYAHSQGVIHRDLKPANIMLTGYAGGKDAITPKVVDFGIAKMLDESDALALTKTGEVFGTPLYMSPEQWAGTGVDERSDIYGLGCVLFEALSGAPPFQGKTAMETMTRHASETPPSLQEASLGRQFPCGLEKVVAKMLAKKSGDRYQTFSQVVDDLNLVQTGDVDRMSAMAERGSKSPLHSIFSNPFTWVSIAVVSIICGIALFLHQPTKPAATVPGTAQKQGMDPVLPSEESIIAQQSTNPDELIKLAVQLEKEGKYVQSENVLKRTIKLNEKNSPPNSTALADSLYHLGLCFVHQDRYADAEPLFKQSLKSAEKALGSNNHDLVEYLYALADCCAHEKKDAEAEPLLRRALAINEKTLEPNNPDMIESLDKLAECCNVPGRYGEAEELMKRALAIRETNIGSNNKELIQPLTDLAQCEKNLGKDGSASRIETRIKAIRLGTQD